jgi:hypothetical protein
MFMKLLPFVFVAASMLAAGPAMADPPTPSRPGHVVVPTVVVYGRVDKPNVVVLVKVPTAAAAAGAAHESLRAALLEASAPAALRAER